MVARRRLCLLAWGVCREGGVTLFQEFHVVQLARRVPEGRQEGSSLRTVLGSMEEYMRYSR